MWMTKAKATTQWTTVINGITFKGYTEAFNTITLCIIIPHALAKSSEHILYNYNIDHNVIYCICKVAYFILLEQTQYHPG